MITIDKQRTAASTFSHTEAKRCTMAKWLCTRHLVCEHLSAGPPLPGQYNSWYHTHHRGHCHKSTCRCLQALHMSQRDHNNTPLLGHCALSRGWEKRVSYNTTMTQTNTRLGWLLDSVNHMVSILFKFCLNRKNLCFSGSFSDTISLKWTNFSKPSKNGGHIKVRSHTHQTMPTKPHPHAADKFLSSNIYRRRDYVCWYVDVCV